MKEFKIVSVSETPAGSKAIYLWSQRGNRSFSRRLTDAASFSESLILSRLATYNNGMTTIAVPADLVETLATDGHLPNDSETWSRIIAGAVRPPAYRPRVGGAA